MKKKQNIVLCLKSSLALPQHGLAVIGAESCD